MKRRWAVRAEFAEGSNALSAAVDAARRSGRPPIDLTVSNPTRCGFDYDAETILQPLASAASLVYSADPLGMLAAREEIAAGYYRPRGVDVSADRMMLTSSTSEAYGYLFRLLCDVRDEVLVPRPSYPLFDLLARMGDVRPVEYPLLLHDGWRVDWNELRRRISGRTRAIVVVHPNNPTGHAVEADERRKMEQIAWEFGLALIVDEVFLDFAVEQAGKLRSFAERASPVLTFVMSGLSKVLALPQMKLAWTVVCGPAEVCAEAVRRLEYIADTFLSPNGPVQQAVGRWLPLGAEMQGQIGRRTRQNLAALDAMLSDESNGGPARPGLCRRLPVQAGWSVVLRVPATMPDEELAVRLLSRAGVVVHPGSFYGLPARGWLLLSLLPEPATFAAGVSRLIHAVDSEITVEAGS